MINRMLQVLHIEDDLVDRMVTERIIKKLGMPISIEHANNGIDALALLRKKAEDGSPLPDFILLDINMAKMNGLEFLKELRSDSGLSSLSVFILTTSADESDRKAAFGFQVAGYFLKPVETELIEKTYQVLKDYWILNQWPER